jgi:hypothetical protein
MKLLEHSLRRYQNSIDTYQLCEGSILQVGNVILSPILEKQGIGLLVGSAGSVSVIGALLAAEAVATAGEATRVKANEVGVTGGLNLSQLVAIAARVPPAIEIPLVRDAAEANGGKYVDT